MTLSPRPHQVEALAALQPAFALHDRAQLVMACGTGKTLVGRWHAQASDANLVLVLLPSLALVAQTLAEWRRATGGATSGWRFEALVVCSDPSTAAGAGERRADTDDPVDLSAKAWEDQRAQVTTDPAVASRFLRAAGTGRPRVVFSTYHSAPVVERAQQRATTDEFNPVFDLAICDEAHHLAGRPSPAFATVLDSRRIVARKRLFMTATPKDVAADDGISMCDAGVFGPVSHTVTFGEAIAAGLLTDYQVLVVAGANEGDPVATVPAVLARAIDTHGLRRVLTFHGRVAKAAAFADAMDGVHTPAGTAIAARHVHGSMCTSDRTSTLSWLGQEGADEVRVVSNARCLSEGIDVPGVDAVMFADKRSSVVDIIQAVGRVLRPAPGKSIGTIVLPLVLEDADGADDDSTLALSRYSAVWTVLRGLRAHDQRMATELDAAARSYGRSGGRHRGHPLARVEFAVPAGVDVEALQLRAVREAGGMWDRNLGLLERWSKDHDGKLISRGVKVDCDDGLVYLGEWCEQQRQLRRRGLLMDSRAALLEQVPGWAWDRAESWWRTTHQQLVDHAAEHGTVADNQEGTSKFAGMKSKSYPRRPLGVWMAEQRQAFRLGVLPGDRVKALEALPGWSWDGGLPATDVDHVEALRQFVEFEKHARVPDGHLEDGLKLSAWCWHVRRRKLHGRLSPVLLDEILAATPSQDRTDVRFSWEVDETRWRTAFAALRQFATREGHPRATAATIEVLDGHDVGLGSWVALQRFKYRHGDLAAEKAALLESVPGWEWEIDLKVVEVDEPVDLSGTATDHGQPGAWSRPHFCKCEVCLEAKRASQNQYARRRRQAITDPVDAGPAAAHVVALEAALSGRDDGTTRNGRSLICAVAGVPLGEMRRVLSGAAPQIERAHAHALLQLTVEQLLAARGVEGSRGRMVSELTSRIDSGPTFDLLEDLRSRGFGPSWVGRELGYAGAPQLRRGRLVQARIANAIQELHDRVGDLQMPKLPASAPRPTLAQLLEEEGAAIAS